MVRSLKVDVELVRIGARHRDFSPAAVERLAQSMKEIGLRQPITIRVVDNHVDPDGEITDGVSILVAGRHRLEAARQLGWEYIDAVDADDDEFQAELWEIAENLHRLDLTKEQRDQHIRRYAELLEARRGVVILEQNEPVSARGPGQPKGLARQIADETGLSKSTVQRALNPKSTASEPPKEVVDVHEQARRRMMSAWNAATEEDRQWFRDWIDTPIMG